MTESAYASTSGAAVETDIPATAANDAVVASLGSPCRMPTSAEFNELHTNCDWTWKQVNGVYGYEVKSKASGNTNSIFLPAAGYVYDGALEGVGTEGDYWSSSILEEGAGNAFGLFFESGSVDSGSDYNRISGLSVRPVQ